MQFAPTPVRTHHEPAHGFPSAGFLFEEPILNTLNVEYRKVEALIPYARNPRTHTDEQVAKIAASIVEYGWTNPVLVDGDNGIIAGHGRLLSVIAIGTRSDARHLDQTLDRLTDKATDRA